MAQRKFSPMASGFTLVSMIGFVVSVLFIYQWEPTYGFTFSIVFLCMFIASMYSMRYANPDLQ